VVEEGNLVYTGEKFSALDSVGKDPNHWLKVGMVHCQIVISQPGHRGMSGDQFRASFGKIGGC